MANFQRTKSNSWNPFAPTERDLQRTEELSQKNALVAGILTFFFTPFGMLYLNRGVNCMKIMGYTFILIFVVVLMEESPEQGNPAINFIGSVANIAIVVEQVNSINQARKKA